MLINNMWMLRVVNKEIKKEEKETFQLTCSASSSLARVSADIQAEPQGVQTGTPWVSEKRRAQIVHSGSTGRNLGGYCNPCFEIS